jgi:hypothetical protein
MSVKPIFWEGRVRIRSAGGVEHHYENFSVTLNPDDSRSLRTFTVSPNGTLVRDVQQSVSAKWEPLHGSSRVFLDGVLQGVVSKWVASSEIHSVVFANGEYSKQSFSRPTGRFSIGFHPIADETWKMALVNLVPGERSPLTTHTCSPTWNGKTIEHGRIVTSEVEYLGIENRRVGGADLDCHSFLWFTPFGKELKIWSFGEHYLFAGLQVLKGDNAGTEYFVSTLRHAVWQ